MEFDDAKENIQPLASGRNAVQLETALHAETDHELQEKLNEQRREYENAIETYKGDDPLDAWYNYIVWVEQAYPKSGKETALHDILAKCLALFEQDERYFQDPRMVKLYIKYIDSEQNPPQFYEQLYNNGIGTMVADLYLCWAHYYDACDNFQKAESVYQKGMDARAQPIELIEQAHRQFGFSMSQRLLYKDETKQREFRSSMEEQRLALTSLRAHKHRHVGSIRTGAAVKSYNPGRVDQHGASSSRRSAQKENRKVQIFEDNGEAPPSPTPSTSVVQSILNSTKKQENLREPGPWNKAKLKSTALFASGTTTRPSFCIMEDDDQPSVPLVPIPLPDSENNFARGIQLPKDFVRQNLPQDDFSFPLHRDEEPAKNTKYKYDKFMLFPAPHLCYSWEELQAYKWFKKRGIQNNFTRTQDKVWATGYDVPMRLPPHFARKNKKQPIDDWTAERPTDHKDVLGDGQRKFGFDINLNYTPTEEFSPDEILQAKWLNGDLVSQRDAAMDMTCGFERREDIYTRKAQRRSMALGGRKSILPPRNDAARESMARMSMARTSIASTSIESTPAKSEQVSVIVPTSAASAPDPRVSVGDSVVFVKETQPVASEPEADAQATGAVKRTCLPKRKSVYMSRAIDALTTIPETASPPVLRRKLNEDEEMAEIHSKPVPPKFSIFEDVETKEPENVFKVPQSAPVHKPRVSSVFQDEDLDGCTTQTFNFFIKAQSISTPLMDKPSAKFGDPEGASSARKGLDFSDDSDPLPEDAAAVKQPFACRSGEPGGSYVVVDADEGYRQKLSAIMETTEECATISSLAATASSKSSSVEDFDYTKQSNQQSVVLSMYRHHTIVNNTAKMSSSNMSLAGQRENESRKVSQLGFEIYQEEDEAPPPPSLKVSETVTVPATIESAMKQSFANTTSKKDEDSIKPLQQQPYAFDKTLPPAGQFHVYEDEDDEKPEQTDTNAKNERSTVAKENEPEKVPDQSVFNISESGTVPSEWSTKSIAKHDISSAKELNKTGNIQNTRDLTLPPNDIAPPKTKPAFQIYREDTAITMPTGMYMPEERTEQIPAFFNGNDTNLISPQKILCEAPSIYMPEIPEDTKNMSKLFAGNVSRMDAPPAINHSTVYNQSVFVLPKGDTTTTNMFAKHFSDDRTETVPMIPNPMQTSVLGNLSAFPMIPEMPTLPEMDFAAEASRNASMMNKSKAVNRTNAEMQRADKTMADQSVFIAADLPMNQSIAAGRKTLVEPNKSILSRTKTTVDDEMFAMISQPNKSVLSKTKTNVDDDMYAMISPPTEANKSTVPKSKTSTDEEINAAVSPGEVNKSIFSKSKPSIDDEFYAMISPTEAANKSILSKSKRIDDEIYAMICPGEANKSIVSKNKTTIDDELYAMIRSPVKPEQTIMIVDTPSPPPPSMSLLRASVAPERKTLRQISLLKETNASLLQRQTSVHEAVPASLESMSSSHRDSHTASPKAFSDENPHTAMFALNMPFLKNSTILHTSKEFINEVTDELKTSLVIDKEKSIAVAPEVSLKPHQKSILSDTLVLPKPTEPNLNEKSVHNKEELPKTPEKQVSMKPARKSDDSLPLPAITFSPALKEESVHIKQERVSQLAGAGKVRSIDDEMYDIIQEKDDINAFDLSIELTADELASIAPKSTAIPKAMEPPKFLISNPVSIRPSQFPMNSTYLNETVPKDSMQQVERSFKDCQLNPPQAACVEEVVVKQEQNSLITVEDTDDLSKVCKAANKTFDSPLQNRRKTFATNPKLNETLSAVKEVDPFDNHLQNAFLDDIEFIEYIRDMDNVIMTTRVRAIELNSELEMGNDTFEILKQIGQGSFGFVYSGKSKTTGKMYAFKQERPANYWEFYISLEIATRIEDPKMIPCFMSVDYATVGHNSSIFAIAYCEYGSLFDICNRHKLNTCRNLDEEIALIFSEQMLSILDHLHASNIIHGDIKPDNFLLMKKLSHGSNELVIKLIDYGRSIDLNFFPPNQTFTSTLNTKNFVCTEMLENRPWKQQIDLFCLASTMYTLVCGKYMNVKKQNSKIRPYLLAESLASYLDVDLWENILYTLINVRDHNSLPDLQKLRLQIRETFVDKDSILQDRIAKFNAVLDS